MTARGSIRRLTKSSLKPRVDDLVSVQHGTAPASRARRLVAAGLASYTDGAGAPLILTPVGAGFVMAAGLGITFFEACVLAKVYVITRSLGGDGLCIHVRTIQRHFEDWPVYQYRVQHALSRLRSRGLLPRAPRQRVACDVKRLSGIQTRLADLDRWIDDTGEEVRHAVLRGDRAG